MVRLDHHCSALPTLPTNRANWSPPSSGCTSLRPRPSLKAPVTQEGPCHYEQQFYLQHVPPAASSQKLWIAQQQNHCQSRWLNSKWYQRLVVFYIQTKDTVCIVVSVSSNQYLSLSLCLCSLWQTHPPHLLHISLPCSFPPGRRRSKSRRRWYHR